MNIIKTEISDVLIFEPKVFGDERGYFYESFNQKNFEEAINRKVEFVQDNHSKSTKGVLRGLHYQINPFAQGKLVRCIRGEVYDIAVDIRKSSATFGHWVGYTLSADNMRQLWIPEGFAHGFVCISDEAEFCYKTTNYYSKENERTIIWNDQTLDIDWKGKNFILSSKDAAAKSFNQADLF
ncbi:dTDP-4-dehydrorhamnose 3,5-epimerase [Citrobacter portucalensis]|uniref:dTDP-4-dehydrorhamnose 3,5-epimerase n=1 Tax=Citrobacter portucalensis TaxID=1639133 RepID=UPI00226BB4B2|nr:dTDP-4-dehydrorhamnose 3,5-epimerase [Citrobacter portucalensis]MCX9031759.1 dTDP-4-dehydrorhamnose 3,5-epimerase [Citrobacter portucalensis]